MSPRRWEGPAVAVAGPAVAEEAARSTREAAQLPPRPNHLQHLPHLPTSAATANAEAPEPERRDALEAPEPERLRRRPPAPELELAGPEARTEKPTNRHPRFTQGRRTNRSKMPRLEPLEHLRQNGYTHNLYARVLFEI